VKSDCYKKLTEILKAKDPDASIANTKRKINSLRSAYRSELKKPEARRKSGAGLNDIYIRVYQHCGTSMTWNFSATKKNKSTVIYPKDYDA
jgi:hypothetical protein